MQPRRLCQWREKKEEAGLHGTTNPEEAKRHTCNLDAALVKMEESIREGVAEDIMKKTIERFKRAIVEIAPYMEEADVTTVLNSIKDTSCMVLMPQTDDREERLEAIMPKLDLSNVSNIVTQAEQLGDLTQEQKELLGELFNELEVAHESLARASGTLGRLSCSLSGKQLLVVLKASVHPLIQLNTLENFWKDPGLSQQKAEARKLHSLTHLLAATLAFKLLRKFGGGTTQ